MNICYFKFGTAASCKDTAATVEHHQLPSKFAPESSQAGVCRLSLTACKFLQDADPQGVYNFIRT